MDSAIFCIPKLYVYQYFYLFSVFSFVTTQYSHNIIVKRLKLINFLWWVLLLLFPYNTVSKRKMAWRHFIFLWECLELYRPKFVAVIGYLSFHICHCGGWSYFWPEELSHFVTALFFFQLSQIFFNLYVKTLFYNCLWKISNQCWWILFFNTVKERIILESNIINKMGPPFSDPVIIVMNWICSIYGCFCGISSSQVINLGVKRLILKCFVVWVGKTYLIEMVS